MTVINIQDGSHFYPIDSLTQTFAEALARRQETVSAFLSRNAPAQWVSDHPLASTKTQQATVAWLKEQKAAGANFIKTEAPLADGKPTMNALDSLYMQIHNNRATGVESQEMAFN